MRPQVSIAAPLVVLVLVSSALGSALDCGMHRRDTQAPAGQSGAAPRDGEACHSGGHGKGVDHQEGAPGSHGDEHRSGPTCCHATLYNAVPLSVSGLEALQATASARRSQEFATPIPPSTLLVSSTVTGHGAGPPGAPFPSALFPGRQLFLAISTLLL